MASAQRKVHSASEQAYLRAVEREERAEAVGGQACVANTAETSDSESNFSETNRPEAKHAEPALPAEDTSEMFRQHSHQQSMEGG